MVLAPLPSHRSERNRDATREIEREREREIERERERERERKRKNARTVKANQKARISVKDIQINRER